MANSSLPILCSAAGPCAQLPLCAHAPVHDGLSPCIPCAALQHALGHSHACKPAKASPGLAEQSAWLPARNVSDSGKGMESTQRGIDHLVFCGKQQIFVAKAQASSFALQQTQAQPTLHLNRHVGASLHLHRDSWALHLHPDRHVGATLAPTQTSECYTCTHTDI